MARPEPAGSLAAKAAALSERLAGQGGLLVAFSGGVDSSLLLSRARASHRGRVLAVTVASALQPEGEVEAARALAGRLGVEHRVLTFDALAEEAVRTNPPDRCYHCKRQILSRLVAMARDEGLGEVIEGSNLDDDDDYRPGRRAVAELGVASPLRDAALTKEAVRALAREDELPCWDAPAMACLASRVPYGVALTEERLRRIDRGEALLRAAGFRQSRLRDHGLLARLEVTPEAISELLEPARRASLAEKIKALGYRFVAVDLEGYRTGALNEALDPGGAEEDEES